MKHLLALLLLSSAAAAQGVPIGAVAPTHQFSYGCEHTLQRVHFWAPETPASPLRLMIRSSGGGFRDRPASAWLGGFGLNQLKFNDETLMELLDLGVAVAVIGFEGADEDAPPEDTSKGLWEGPPDPEAEPCDAMDYFSQALQAFQALLAFCVTEYGSEPEIIGWSGNSAGSMQAFQVAAAMPDKLDFIIAGNTPLSWLALIQAGQPTELSFLRKSINQVPQNGVPYNSLVEAALADQAGAGCWQAAITFTGDVLWLTDFPSQVLLAPGGAPAPWPYNYGHQTSPVIYNRILDIHDASQAGSAFLVRNHPGDIYFCEEEDARGFTGEGTYVDDPLDTQHQGVRSEAVQLGVVLGGVTERFGL